MTAQAEQNPEALFQAVVARFERAARSTGVVERWYDLMGCTVVVRFAGPGLEQALTPALGHRAIPPGAAPAGETFVLYAWDAASTGVGLPPVPWPSTALRPKGIIDGFNDERFSTVFSLGNLFNVYDRVERVGAFWLPDADELPYWERGFPFRTLLHLASAGRPVQLVHSGAVGIGTQGVLLTGVGGSGKSTTCLLCLEAGLGYAGDDYTAFELLGNGARVHSLYSSAKVDAATLGRFPRLRPVVSNVHALENGNEKALLFLHPAYGDQLGPGFAIRAVLLPRVTGNATTRLIAASPMATTRALAPTSVFQLPRHDDEAFAAIVTLARRVPSFHLELGEDVERIPQLIAEVIDGRRP